MKCAAPTSPMRVWTNILELLKRPLGSPSHTLEQKHSAPNDQSETAGLVVAKVVRRLVKTREVLLAVAGRGHRHRRLLCPEVRERSKGESK